MHPDALGRGIGTALLGWTEDSRGATGLDEGVADHDGRQRPRPRPSCRSPWLWLRPHLLDPGDRARRAARRSDRCPPGSGSATTSPSATPTRPTSVIEDAFNEWPNRDPATFEDWAAFTIERPSFAPWQMILVTDEAHRGHRGCDASCSSTRPRVGGSSRWRRAAIAPPPRHRPRHAATARSRCSGTRAKRVVGLNTDSRTGALGMYEKVGMQRHAFLHQPRQAAVAGAVAEGFEPSRELPPYTLSRRVPSAARAGHRGRVYRPSSAVPARPRLDGNPAR